MRLKKSPKRDRILEVIRGTKSHPTAEWVYLKLKDEMPELSLATVSGSAGAFSFHSFSFPISNKDSQIFPKRKGS